MKKVLVWVALTIEAEDDFPRYSEEERDKEFSRDPAVANQIYSEPYLRDIANETDEPYDLAGYVEENLVYYLGDSRVHPDRRPRITDASVFTEPPLPEQEIA